MELWYTEEWTQNVRLSIKATRHLYSEKSEFQQVDILESKEFGRFLTLDGLMMANEKDEFIYHDCIVHPAMATNPNIKKVLVIGAGDGGTVRELTRYPGIEKIDMVEIDELVVRSCQQFLPITAEKLDDPRVSLYFEDGVAFAKNSKDGYYDLVIVDSTDPIGPGEGLFSVDFYKDCYRILAADGILVNQHESPYFERDAREMKRSHSKIKALFPISRVYQAHIPTYPSGHWLFGFASKKLDPLKDADFAAWKELGLKTKYYNTDLHTGAFALPTYVREMLDNATA
ncbi:MAG: polyamine aminopropyltransferase [Turicibacter sp.]|nr:polyamine aminopropyltransferase [Turicibacter sp.]